MAQGAYVRVTAIDATSGIEATIVGAASAAQATLERTARAKLDYVLKRDRTK